jgi:deoxycytidine triphosphate deaminase
MALNIEEIEELGLVQNLKDGKLLSEGDHPLAASHYLTVGRVINSKGEEEDPSVFTLEPQEMAIVISYERLKLPLDVIGYTLPRMTLHDKGILMLSTAAVDPGYEGLMSSTLINFGQKPYPLTEGRRFMRVAFHRLSELKNPKLRDKLKYHQGQANLQDNEYIIKRQEMAQRFPETFLDISSNVSEIAERVVGLRANRTQHILAWAAVAAAIFTFLLAVVAFLGAPIVSELTMRNVSENAAARVLGSEEVEPLREDVGDLEDRLEKLETE